MKPTTYIIITLALVAVVAIQTSHALNWKRLQEALAKHHAAQISDNDDVDVSEQNRMEKRFGSLDYGYSRFGRADQYGDYDFLGMRYGRSTD